MHTRKQGSTYMVGKVGDFDMLDLGSPCSLADATRESDIRQADVLRVSDTAGLIPALHMCSAPVLVHAAFVGLFGILFASGLAVLAEQAHVPGCVFRKNLGFVCTPVPVLVGFLFFFWPSSVFCYQFRLLNHKLL